MKPMNQQYNRGAKKKTEIDGIKFDSAMEAAYYVHLKGRLEVGEILGFDLQPKFLLQAAFEKHGVKTKAIYYVADFRVRYLDGSTLIVDIKGAGAGGLKPDFKLKRKMYDYRHPEKLVCLCPNPKIYGGGWTEVETLDAIRTANRKAKKGAKNDETDSE